MPYIPLLLEELVAATQDGDRCKTPSGIPFDNVSIVAVVKRLIGSVNTGEKKRPPSIIIGDELYDVFAKPFNSDTDAIELVGQLLEGTLVHIDGIASFYKAKPTEPAKLSLTVQNVRIIQRDADAYRDLWFWKLLNARRTDPFPAASKFVTKFIPKYNIIGRVSGDYFYCTGVPAAPKALFTRKEKPAETSLPDTPSIPPSAVPDPPIPAPAKTVQNAPVPPFVETPGKKSAKKTSSVAKPVSTPMPDPVTAPPVNIPSPAVPSVASSSVPASGDLQRQVISVMSAAGKNVGLTLEEVSTKVTAPPKDVYVVLCKLKTAKVLQSRYRGGSTIEFFVP